MREPIPPAVAADALYRSDRTCCVCNQPGRPTQIHHIDGDPSNNRPDNLAVLCLLCHNDTEVRGGFGRQLSAPVVTRYRDAWVQRVSDRRARADELAARHAAGLSLVGVPADPIAFIDSLPTLRFYALRESTPQWQSGVTTDMLQASYDYLTVLEGVFVRLVACFPRGHFGDAAPDAIASSWQAQLFGWHRARLEPRGIGTGGSIVGVLAAGFVIADVERLIQEAVQGLSEDHPQFDLIAWRKRWKRKPRSGASGT